MEHVFYLFSALALGALHALEPGHGKTLIAAYMLGNKGTVGDAVKLGAVVTFTHTVGVVALGLLLLFFSSYFLSGTVEKCAQVLSSVIVLLVGAGLLFRSFWAYKNKNHDGHDHDHHHDHHHHLHHDHSHDHGDSKKGLLWLGVSGGIVPCHGALAVLLGALAAGGSAKLLWGLLMVVFFSLGLAVVVMVLALLAARISNIGWLRKMGISADAEKKIALRLPMITAGIIFVLGVYMTANNLGYIGPRHLESEHEEHLLQSGNFLRDSSRG